jgi:predicted metal-dependent enzyme (double-stranded beta helix superfamily)
MREACASFGRSPFEEATMAYDLEQFIADCRTALSRDPGPRGREEVRARLERLLANPDFLRRYCGDDQPQGLRVLHQDPELGFQILAHINDQPRTSPPHDHGESWAIYGQATQYTDMTEWERLDDGSDPEHTKLQPKRKYRLTPGQAGIYQDRAIHSIDYPAKARFIRVTGTNLDRIPRLRFDPATGKATQMTQQQAT